MSTRETRIGFFDRLKTGWTLTKDSFGVIREFPELLAFPLLAGVASVLFFVLLFFPLLFAGLLVDGLEYVVLFVLYLSTTFVSTYCSAALVYGANQALHGENPDLVDCLRAVREQVGPIFVWSVIAASVSLLLRLLEEKDTPIAALLRALFAAGWSIMTFFIVPVIVFEEVTVTSMFKRSASVFRDTWGETLGSGFGITLLVMGIGAVLVGFSVVVAGVLALLSPALGLVLGILLLVAVLVFTYLLGQTVWVISKTALYLYAVEGRRPDQFQNFEFETLGGRTRARPTTDSR